MTTKLKELVIYVAEKSKDDPAFGLTKLNKVLFAIDFRYFGAEGQSITEADYVHRANGPVPNVMPIILTELTESGKAELKETTYFGHTQKRLFPFTGPDLSIFSDNELAFIHMASDYFKPWNATQLSEWTHKLIPWLITEDGEKIPYASVFILQKIPIEKFRVLKCDLAYRE